MMNDRKDIPPVPPKAEAQRPTQPAPRPTPQQAAQTPTQVQPPAQAKLMPAAAGGFGHSGTVFRPVSSHNNAAPAAPRPQAAAPAPKPIAPVAAVAEAPKPNGPVAAAPKPVAPAPVAAVAEARKPSVPVATAPKPVAPAPVAAALPAPAREAKAAKPAKPLPALAKSPAFNPLTINPWMKAFGAKGWMAAYPKAAPYGDGMRAAFAAGAILFRGVDRLAQELIAFVGEQMASSAAAAEEFGNCRSFEALIARQSSIARANFDRVTTAADKLTQMSVALAEEVCEPIADEVDAAANRIIETLAR